MAKKAEKEARSGAGSGPAATPASAAKTSGRYLQLKFKGDPPVLDRIEFRFSSGSDWRPSYFQRGDEQFPLNWPDVESALSLCFLGYVDWRNGNGSGPFLFGADAVDATLAKQLSGAIYQTGHKIHELFFGENPTNKTNDPIVTHLVFPAIPGVSKSGRSRTKPLSIPVSERFLPPDCVQVFWDCRGSDPLKEISDFRELAKRIRESLEITSAETLPATSHKATKDSLLRTPTTPGPQQPTGDAATISQSSSPSAIREPDVAKQTVKADLRAKMARAQELHGRDKGGEAVALLEEVRHSAHSHGLRHEELVAILNLGLLTHKPGCVGSTAGAKRTKQWFQDKKPSLRKPSRPFSSCKVWVTAGASNPRLVKPRPNRKWSLATMNRY